MSTLYHWSTAQFVCVLALSLAFALWRGAKAPSMSAAKTVGVAGLSVCASLVAVFLADIAFF